MVLYQQETVYFGRDMAVSVSFILLLVYWSVQGSNRDVLLYSTTGFCGRVKAFLVLNVMVLVWGAASQWVKPPFSGIGGDGDR